MADENPYITVKEDGTIVIEPDGHISAENIDDMSFSFQEGQDITESVSKKNANSKTVVSYTKKGRTGYAPMTVTYPDGASTSSKFILEDCIIQHTPALTAVNHSYGKSFIFIGVPTMYIDKIMTDARNNSQINLVNKANVQELNGYYWERCNLEKLSHKDCQIITEAGPFKMAIDAMLKEVKTSIIAAVTFTLSASMNTDTMEEELDLKDGTYTIAMKPTELFATSTTDIKGPELVDTNNRKKEGSAISANFVATGALAELAAKRMRGGRKIAA